MAQRFVLVEIIVTVIFLLISPLADYGEMYEKARITSVIAFNAMEIIGIALIETAIVFGIFFSWLSTTYALSRERITYTHGLFIRRSTVVAMEDIQSVQVRQGIFARLARYGTLELQNARFGKAIQLPFVHDPQRYAALISKLKQGRSTPQESFTPVSVPMLLASGEHERLEFKSTFRWDVRNHNVNKMLEKAVMKTVAAFLNSQGGSLMIGVDDQHRVTGLAQDFATLGRRDADGFENHFTNIFHTMIGRAFRQHVKLSFPTVDGAVCCHVQVSPSPRPVYLKNDDRVEEFYVRTGNTTASLTFSEAGAYIATRFTSV